MSDQTLHVDFRTNSIIIEMAKLKNKKYVTFFTKKVFSNKELEDVLVEQFNKTFQKDNSFILKECKA